mmetsp:Transcript_19136/g.31247  ORF Transcript_19136/g.31247 Transcript_19136/m.31247 type:complete len:188 (-) Transcript_19136:898-1461(-)|eukprot:CAMPEP_0201960064 /NCGR_PEP_ID=MMETSP0904-20121228/6875_1 /ASSEMBLY_ACC=CAM_ASM_000553 /TAXON_ID=420261 /ORGANISM="Thalassiosira antarctica, Strain CCMP982" /LENGTH=187 /DNA_ID=CAMNT_0048505905 /DNA_START=453 /DNA_END=1016 /DNA_ORIENTATION=-
MQDRQGDRPGLHYCEERVGELQHQSAHPPPPCIEEWGLLRREHCAAAVRGAVPAAQSQGRCTARAILPEKLLTALRTSAYHYDTKKAVDDRLKKAKAEAHAKAEESAKAIRYPHISKLFVAGEKISLDNPQVKQLSGSVLQEVVQLYKDEGEDISFMGTNGRDISLLPVPRSSDRSDFLIDDSKLAG